jgi:DNA-binding NarL/FixJ family response regulator
MATPGLAAGRGERWLAPGRRNVPWPAVAPDPAGGAAPGAQPRRLLIVEDDWLIASQIEACLAAAGYEIAGHAADGTAALALAERERPDLVLMDIRLRGAVDGIAAAQAILDRLAIPTLYVSAHADPGTLARAQATRPRGWVLKPFTDTELLEAVRSALAVP